MPRQARKVLSNSTHHIIQRGHNRQVVFAGDNAENLGLLMKRVAGRQTRYVNKIEKRTGSLWEGRYKSSLINASEYLLACCQYVELNPVRAGIVEDPGEYRWSSCSAKVGLKEHLWLDLDPFYLSLGNTPAVRAKKYGRWLKVTVSEMEWKLIREAVQRGQLTADKKFEKEIPLKLGRRIELRGPGRPRKKK